MLPDSLTTWEVQGVGISNSGKQIEVIYLREEWSDLAKTQGFLKITVFLVYPELKRCRFLKSVYSVLPGGLDKLTSRTVSVSSFVLQLVIIL